MKIKEHGQIRKAHENMRGLPVPTLITPAKEDKKLVSTSNFIFDGLKGQKNIVQSINLKQKTNGKFNQTLKILEHVGGISPDMSDLRSRLKSSGV